MIFWGIIAVAIATGVGILIFLAVRAIFEFIVDHSVLKVIVIGLFALTLAGMLGPEILLIVGVILLVRFVIYGIGWLVNLIPSSPSLDPMAVAPKVRKEENDEEEYKIIDFDTCEYMFVNKYIYIYVCVIR